MFHCQAFFMFSMSVLAQFVIGVETVSVSRFEVLAVLACFPSQSGSRPQQKCHTLLSKGRIMGSEVGQTAGTSVVCEVLFPVSRQTKSQPRISPGPDRIGAPALYRPSLHQVLCPRLPSSDPMPRFPPSSSNNIPAAPITVFQF
jgi:hypothetical protein